MGVNMVLLQEDTQGGGHVDSGLLSYKAENKKKQGTIKEC